MQKSFIRNFDGLAINENRRLALGIMESGLEAINTEGVILKSVLLKGDVLSIQGKDFNLSEFETIKVVPILHLVKFWCML